LAATRKRTLRSATARSARSVWSKCQSRVIESRNTHARQGLPVSVRGGSIAMHVVRRHLQGAQARCVETGPGSESRAEAHGGILESWERPHRSLEHCRNRTTPAYQRPGAWAAFPAVFASEIRETTRGTASEGNRSERDGGCGSLSGLIVAFESRVTNRREPVSSEGDHRGEEGAIWAGRWGDSASIKRLTTLVAHSLRERILSHEEPDALIALVRVCGGVGGQPPALPGV
jgi:hypothetical protein